MKKRLFVIFTLLLSLFMLSNCDLEGLISPLEGINPEDIKINQLIQRIKNENIKENIIDKNNYEEVLE